MEWLRVARNPWGEEVVLGLAWGVAWVVVVLGALFIVGHAFFVGRKKEGAMPTVDPAVAATVPAHVVRHGKSARISHWILAASVLALLATAFVPMLGLQFPWLTIHWVAGVVFGLYIIYHTLDTTIRLSWGKMLWIGWRETVDAVRRVTSIMSGKEGPSKNPGKWGFENKLFHHLTALAGLAVVVTGVLMMLRIDTWFWAADPYRLEFTDADWGLIFVLHGLSAVGFIGLIMAHIYLAVRPDDWWITRSMIKGWITKDEYLTHHDPSLWPVSKGSPAASERREEKVGAGASSSSSRD